MVSPATGLAQPGYAKRKLVPFGEFIPLRPVLGWIEKFAPIGGDFQRGTDAAPLLVPAGSRRVPVGVLICFEDIFPSLARASVLEGADLIRELIAKAGDRIVIMPGGGITTWMASIVIGLGAWGA